MTLQKGCPVYVCDITRSCAFSSCTRFTLLSQNHSGDQPNVLWKCIRISYRGNEEITGDLARHSGGVVAMFEVMDQFSRSMKASYECQRVLVWLSKHNMYLILYI